MWSDIVNDVKYNFRLFDKYLGGTALKNMNNNKNIINYSFEYYNTLIERYITTNADNCVGTCAELRDMVSNIKIYDSILKPVYDKVYTIMTAECEIHRTETVNPPEYNTLYQDLISTVFHSITDPSTKKTIINDTTYIDKYRAIKMACLVHETIDNMHKYIDTHGYVIFSSGWASEDGGHLVGIMVTREKIFISNSGAGVDMHPMHEDDYYVSVAIDNTPIPLFIIMYHTLLGYINDIVNERIYYNNHPYMKLIHKRDSLCTLIAQHDQDLSSIENLQLSGSCSFYGMYYAIKCYFYKHVRKSTYFKIWDLVLQINGCDHIISNIKLDELNHRTQVREHHYTIAQLLRENLTNMKLLYDDIHKSTVGNDELNTLMINFNTHLDNIDERIRNINIEQYMIHCTYLPTAILQKKYKLDGVIVGKLDDDTQTLNKYYDAVFGDILIYEKLVNIHGMLIYNHQKKINNMLYEYYCEKQLYDTLYHVDAQPFTQHNIYNNIHELPSMHIINTMIDVIICIQYIIADNKHYDMATLILLNITVKIYMQYQDDLNFKFKFDVDYGDDIVLPMIEYDLKYLFMQYLQSCHILCKPPDNYMHSLVSSLSNFCKYVPFTTGNLLFWTHRISNKISFSLQQIRNIFRTNNNTAIDRSANIYPTELMNKMLAFLSNNMYQEKLFITLNNSFSWKYVKQLYYKNVYISNGIYIDNYAVSWATTTCDMSDSSTAYRVENTIGMCKNINIFIDIDEHALRHTTLYVVLTHFNNTHNYDNDIDLRSRTTLKDFAEYVFIVPTTQDITKNMIVIQFGIEIMLTGNMVIYVTDTLTCTYSNNINGVPIYNSCYNIKLDTMHQPITYNDIHIANILPNTYVHTHSDVCNTVCVEITQHWINDIILRYTNGVIPTLIENIMAAFMVADKMGITRDNTFKILDERMLRHYSVSDKRMYTIISQILGHPNVNSQCVVDVSNDTHMISKYSTHKFVNAHHRCNDDLDKNQQIITYKQCDCDINLQIICSYNPNNIYDNVVNIKKGISVVFVGIPTTYILMHPQPHIVLSCPPCEHGGVQVVLIGKCIAFKNKSDINILHPICKIKPSLNSDEFNIFHINQKKMSILHDSQLSKSPTLDLSNIFKYKRNFPMINIIYLLNNKCFDIVNDNFEKYDYEIIELITIPYSYCIFGTDRISGNSQYYGIYNDAMMFFSNKFYHFFEHENSPTHSYYDSIKSLLSKIHMPILIHAIQQHQLTDISILCILYMLIKYGVITPANISSYTVIIHYIKENVHNTIISAANHPLLNISLTNTDIDAYSELNIKDILLILFEAILCPDTHSEYCMNTYYTALRKLYHQYTYPDEQYGKIHLFDFLDVYIHNIPTESIHKILKLNSSEFMYANTHARDLQQYIHHNKYMNIAYSSKSSIYANITVDDERTISIVNRNGVINNKIISDEFCFYKNENDIMIGHDYSHRFDYTICINDTHIKAYTNGCIYKLLGELLIYSRLISYLLYKFNSCKQIFIWERVDDGTLIDSIAHDVRDTNPHTRGSEQISDNLNYCFKDIRYMIEFLDSHGTDKSHLKFYVCRDNIIYKDKLVVTRKNLPSVNMWALSDNESIILYEPRYMDYYVLFTDYIKQKNVTSYVKYNIWDDQIYGDDDPVPDIINKFNKNKYYVAKVHYTHLYLMFDDNNALYVYFNMLSIYGKYYPMMLLCNQYFHFYLNHILHHKYNEKMDLQIMPIDVPMFNVPYSKYLLAKFFKLCKFDLHPEVRELRDKHADQIYLMTPDYTDIPHHANSYEYNIPEYITQLADEIRNAINDRPLNVSDVISNALQHGISVDDEMSEYLHTLKSCDNPDKHVILGVLDKYDYIVPNVDSAYKNMFKKSYHTAYCFSHILYDNHINCYDIINYRLLNKTIIDIRNVCSESCDCLNIQAIINIINTNNIYIGHRPHKIYLQEALLGFPLYTTQMSSIAQIYNEIEVKHTFRIHNNIMGAGKTTVISPSQILRYIGDTDDDNVFKKVIVSLPIKLQPKFYNDFIKTFSVICSNNCVYNLKIGRDTKYYMDFFKRDACDIIIIDDVSLKSAILNIASRGEEPEFTINKYFTKFGHDEDIYENDKVTIARPIKSDTICEVYEHYIFDPELPDYVLRNKPTNNVHRSVKQYYDRQLDNIYYDTGSPLIISDEIDDLLNPMKNMLNFPICEKIVYKNNQHIIEMIIEICSIIYKLNDNTIPQFDNIESAHKCVKNALQKYELAIFKNEIDYVCDKLKIKPARPAITHVFYQIVGIVHKVIKSFGMILTSKYNVNYGFGDMEVNNKVNSKNYMTAIPYIYSNTPDNGSEFSCHIYKLCLTTICYHTTLLRYDDIVNIIKHIKQEMIINKSHSFIEIKYDWLFTIITQLDDTYVHARPEHGSQMITSEPESKSYICLGKEINKPEILKHDTSMFENNTSIIAAYLMKIGIHMSIPLIMFYLKNIVLNKYIFSYGIQYNTSYIETITNVASIGFTGTTNNLYLPILKDKEFNVKSVCRNRIDYGNIKCTLKCVLRPHTLINILSANDPLIPQIYTLIEQLHIDVLIDAGALFTHNSMYDIYNSFAKPLHRDLIYVDNGIISIFDGVHVNRFIDVINTSKHFTYYDHASSRGVNIEQPRLLKGLITISDINNTTNTAQGCYRMRKLELGHSIESAMMPSKYYMDNYKNIYSPETLYSYLEYNEALAMESAKNIFLLQNIKAIRRQHEYSTTRTYSSFLENIFMDVTLSEDDIVNNTHYKKFIIENFCNSSDDITTNFKNIMKKHYQEQSDPGLLNTLCKCLKDSISSLAKLDHVSTMKHIAQDQERDQERDHTQNRVQISNLSIRRSDKSKFALYGMFGYDDYIKCSNNIKKIVFGGEMPKMLINSSWDDIKNQPRIEYKYHYVRVCDSIKQLFEYLQSHNIFISPHMFYILSSYATDDYSYDQILSHGKYVMDTGHEMLIISEDEFVSLYNYLMSHHDIIISIYDKYCDIMYSNPKIETAPLKAYYISTLLKTSTSIYDYMRINAYVHKYHTTIPHEILSNIFNYTFTDIIILNKIYEHEFIKTIETELESNEYDILLKFIQYKFQTASNHRMIKRYFHNILTEFKKAYPEIQQGGMHIRRQYYYKYVKYRSKYNELASHKK